MAIKLTQKTELLAAVDLSPIDPKLLASLSVAEIEKVSIGNAAIGDCFDVSGSIDDNTIRLCGDFSQVDHIGSHMSVGTMHVDGDVGHFAGSQMHGGTLHIHGNVGDYAGGAVATESRGMRGGTLLVDGNAGSRLGYRMRRGLLAVAGDVGPMPAAHMLAGTIAIFGKCGARPAAGMRRGTVLLTQTAVDQILPTFRSACHQSPLVMRLILTRLGELGFECPKFPERFTLFSGDTVEGCRGELWLCP